MKPVVIVGAGPAGISAARTLLDYGIRACLVHINIVEVFNAIHKSA
jgi:flavin-dependent dehydrogenase